MTTFANALASAAVIVTVGAVVVLWRHRLRSIVAALSVQGVALAATAALLGAHEHDRGLLAVAGLVLLVKAVVIPGLLARVVAATPGARESDPLVNIPASLVVAGLLTLGAFVAARPIVALVGEPTGKLVPLGLATVLIGFFTMVARRRAMSQVVGLLLVDNGIALVAFLVTSGVPVIVELGSTLDVLFGVVVLRVLLARLSAAGFSDLDQLRSLHD